MLLPLVLGCLALSPPVICLDPGHPSEVSRGTAGKRSTEIQVVYRIAGLLKQRLIQDGYRVVMTKSREEQKVTNRRRAEIANRSGADLMLRLHCDASNGSGFAVYYPSQPGHAGGLTGPSQEVIDRSGVAAHKLFSAMKNALGGVFPTEGLKTDLQTAVGSKQGALTGSVFSKVPTVLVEMVVLTNPHDEDWILSKEGETAMVTALEAGVKAAVHR